MNEPNKLECYIHQLEKAYQGQDSSLMGPFGNYEENKVS
jgi:hypothetical protein